MSTMNDVRKPEARHEPEFTGPGWKNPYVIYIVLTLVLFGFLVLMGYVAWTNGWIPNRGAAS
jgi:hypothetical protein